MLDYNGLTADELKDDHEALQELIEEVQATVQDNEFVDSVAEQYEEKGSLTTGQIEGLLKFYARIR